MAQPAPFTLHPDYTGLVLAYNWGPGIADDVLPRVPVGKQEYRRKEYNKKDAFSLPDDLVGRKGKPKQIETTSTEVSGLTKDRGFDYPVPVVDIENAGQGEDLQADAAEFTTQAILRKREKRVADLVMTAANYAASQKVTLTGNDQWDSGHADSDPVEDVDAGKEKILAADSLYGAVGISGWNAMKKNPKLIQAIRKQAVTSGILTRREVADFFELEDLYVGVGRVDTANPGQSATIVRVWPDSFLLFHKNLSANTRQGTTFGYTAQFGQRTVMTKFDDDMGVRGSHIVRVYESVDEVLWSDDFAYLISDVAA